MREDYFLVSLEFYCAQLNFNLRSRSLASNSISKQGCWCSCRGVSSSSRSKAQLTSGVCMALEIVWGDPNKNSYEEFRNFCGPTDPVMPRLAYGSALVKLLEYNDCAIALDGNTSNSTFLEKLKKAFPNNFIEDIELYGLTNFAVKELDFDLFNTELKAFLEFPKILMQSLYTIDGKILMLPIVGAGPRQAKENLKEP
uniref:Uncharacterized protein n=1 Tax=Glossina austeni TaxID=7395 RepID=A0A1A9UZX7_GLOAU